MPGQMERIIIGYQGKRHIVHKPSTIDKLVEETRRRFSIPEDTNLFLRFFPDLGSSAAVALSANYYQYVGDLTYIAFSIAAHSCLDDESVVMEPLHSRSSDDMKRKSEGTSLIKVFIKTLTGKTKTFQCEASTFIFQLKWALQDAEGIPTGKMPFLFAGKQLFDTKGFGEYNIRHESTIHLVLRLRGGKPAIYLLSPVSMEDVKISVTLSPEWSFTVLYPLAKPITDTKHNTSRVEWTVGVPGETLADYSTGIKCSYLFWEAEAVVNQPALAVSAADTQAASGSEEVFNPSAPSLTPNNACVLSFEHFIPRLDCILEGLCLTPAMRTEFIVYWLPRFQHIGGRGLHIAFRFVNQDAFNKAAKIEVTGCPPPTAIARIFMLFGGVSPLETGKPWSGTACDSDEAQSFNWAKAIGFDVKSWDKGSFRVLEWRGMEVPGTMLN